MNDYLFQVLNRKICLQLLKVQIKISFKALYICFAIR